MGVGLSSVWARVMVSSLDIRARVSGLVPGLTPYSFWFHQPWSRLGLVVRIGVEVGVAAPCCSKRIGANGRISSS